MKCCPVVAVAVLIAVAGVAMATDTAKTVKPSTKPAAATPPHAAAPAVVPAKGDTLVINGRIAEIPGKFAPNDLYNYVYVMKYRVLGVEKGAYKGQDILVGVYNPLIPRGSVKDKMAKLALGNVQKFEVGAKHRLVLIAPIDNVWKDAVEDEYADSELEKFYALRVDMVK